MFLAIYGLEVETYRGYSLYQFLLTLVGAYMSGVDLKALGY